jgi:hypothetical protein
MFLITIIMPESLIFVLFLPYHCQNLYSASFRPHRQFRNHFSRAFKEVVGMSPSHYRKLLQEVRAVASP